MRCGRMEELVHIVALGWERERAVESVLSAKAHMVYLLSRKDDKLNGHFIGLVRKDLEKHLPSRNIEVIEIPKDWEFQAVLMHTARLIAAHRAKGHRIYLHIASGSK